MQSYCSEGCITIVRPLCFGRLHLAVKSFNLASFNKTLINDRRDIFSVAAVRNKNT